MATITTSRSSFLRVLHRLGVDTRYLLVSFPIGVASFVAIVTGLALGVGLLITVVGLPILAVTLRLAGRFAALERAHIAPVHGPPSPEVNYRTAPSQMSQVKRLLTVVTDPRRWRETVHGLVRFPVATLTWSLTVTCWSVALAGLSYPLWAWSLPQGSHTSGLGELLGLPGLGWDLGLTFGIGLIAALTLPGIMHGLATTQAALGRGLLIGSAAVTIPVDPVHVPSSSSS